MESGADPAMFQHRLLYRIGLFTHDQAKAVLAVGLLFTLGLASMMVLVEPDWSESFGEGDLESSAVFSALGSDFGDPEANNTETFFVLVHHPNLPIDDPSITDVIDEVVRDLEQHPAVTVTRAWEIDEANRSSSVSEDGEWSRSSVQITLGRSEAKTLLKEHWKTMEQTIHDAGVHLDDEADITVYLAGPLATDATFDLRLKDDLIRAELGSGPLVAAVLLVVFGSLVAAVLPLGIGVLTVVSAFGVTIWLSTLEGANVNNFAGNIITLLGLGVSIDYSLFMVYRYREERANGLDIRTALAVTSATAGRAVFYSGITVAIGLTGMLFFENTGAPSLGIGGTLAVTLAMLTSVLMLPAFLAVLGENVDRYRVPFGMNATVSEDGFWAWIANSVMARPVVVLVPILILLLGAGVPFLGAEWGITSIRSLPPDDMARNGLEEMEVIWAEASDKSIFLHYDAQAHPLDEEQLRHVHALGTELLERDDVEHVFAPGFFDPEMTAEQVVQFWSLPEAMLSPELIGQREALRNGFISASNDSTFIQLTLVDDWNSPEALMAVEDLRTQRDGGAYDAFNATTPLVGGLAAYNLDVVDAVAENLPISMAYIFLATCLILFIQVRSVVIPIKAIVMNILSVTATFGMLVFIFQEGGFGLDQVMNFTPEPIDPTTPVMLFCIVFGLSMDYEVLMLSRIHEEWERTGDNTLAVANGLQKTGRLITAAAAIMVFVFSAQIFASVAIIKMFGLGLALAIFVDATLVRALVVPATMRLMGPLNWWAPRWLASPSPAASKTTAPQRLQMQQVVEVLQRALGAEAEE